ncbi:hypothetical protein [Amycolatopsis minnesotensis]|uniref:Uncharacterized protein n=1 Tax=Amycolatopsis minnesotensis TaxID=337894 RepID=A0ABN2SQW8_9PSEU
MDLLTNAYSGSLSFANFSSRVPHRHPGRVWYVLVNCGIALALMEFKRAYLHKINPAGFGAMLLASALSITAYFGAFGEVLARLAR